jgi:hypothetical protein
MPTALPAIRHPQRPHHGRDPGDGRATDATGSSSSACTAWARRCTTSCARGDTARLPHLCARGAASRPAGLSGAAAAGKRRQQFLRQPGARRSTSRREVARDPFDAEALGNRMPRVASPAGPVPPERPNSRGSTCMTGRVGGPCEGRRATFATTRLDRRADPRRRHAGSGRGAGPQPRATRRQRSGTVTLTAPPMSTAPSPPRSPWSAPAPDRAATS